MDNPKYQLYSDGSRYGYKLFKTTNLNPYNKTDQHDDMYQVLKAMRPDLSDKEILSIITKERIRRAEMDLATPSIDRILKENISGYEQIKVNKKYNLKQVIDMCESGKTIIRMGTRLIVYDADTGNIYTGISQLYTMRPVTAYWKETK